MPTLLRIMKLLGLCLALNLIRYFVIGFVEQAFIFDPLFGAMEQSNGYFRTDFQTIDWVTSYLYNFVMWFVAVFAFDKSYPHLTGSMIIRSLKVFGLMLVLFLSISAIYMNHYSHPKDFYLWNMIDAVVVFPLVAVANGFLYPLFFRTSTTGT